MVALTARFTLLSTLISLAAISSVEAAAVRPRSDSTTAADKPPRQQTPVVPLPMSAMKKSAKGKSHEGKGKDHKKHKGKAHKAVRCNSLFSLLV